MKALEIPSEAQHLILLEKGDRFLRLEGTETAVVISDTEGDVESVNVVVHFPEPTDDTVPLSVVLSACVREFLNDPEWVAVAQERIKVAQETLKEKESSAAAE